MQQTPVPDTIADRLEFARVKQADLAAEADRLQRASAAATKDFQDDPDHAVPFAHVVAEQKAKNARAAQQMHETEVLTPLLEEQARAEHAARVAAIRRELDPDSITHAVARIEHLIRQFIGDVDVATSDLVRELELRLGRDQDLAAAGLPVPRHLASYITEIRERLGTNGVALSYLPPPNAQELTLQLRRSIQANLRIG
jgi:hypothetical protein